jgi:hypothetical protein
MKTRDILIIGLAAAVLAAIALQRAKHERQQNKKLSHISDQGYELAEDILYPLTARRRRS